MQCPAGRASVGCGEFLARYAEIADELVPWLDGLEIVHQVAPVLGEEATAGDADEEAGLRELGDFRLVRELGRGGMGVVYEAHQVSLNRRVALKVLPFAAVLDPRRLQRFKAESLAAAGMDHPGIVRIYSVGCERGVHYYAMQYIEGRTLAQVIQGLSENRTRRRGQAHFAPKTPQNEPVPGGFESATGSSQDREFFRAAAGLGIQAAEAMEHAHQMGVVHRDIKPSNLMLDDQGHLWVTDFGLAMTQLDSELTVSGDILGTIRYMSPEQAAGCREVLGQQTDIYSLGVTLYELLTLQPPFGEESRQHLLRRIAEAEPPRPRQINRAIPRDLETIILKAMAKEPQARYASAQAMAEDLRRFRRDEPILARRATPGERAGKWARRHAPLIASAAAGLVVAVVVAVASIIFVAAAWNDAVQQRDLARQRELAMRHHVYAADLKLAYQAWMTGDVPWAEQILDRQRPQPGQPDFREFAWRYLWALVHRQRFLLTGHMGDVYCVKFSPDGRRLASAGKDGTVRLWDAASGECRKVLDVHEGEVCSVAFSPDGALLASAGDGEKIHLWETSTGRHIASLEGHRGEVFALQFSPDGRWLASGGHDRKVRLWSAGDWREPKALFPHNQRVEALCFSPDSRTLATASDDCAVRLWDVATGELRQKLFHPNTVLAVAFSRDGGWLVTGSKPRRLWLFELAGGDRKLELEGHRGWVQSVAFSPGNDGVFASTSKDGTVRLWNATTGETLQVIRGHVGCVWWVDFSPDSSRLATAGADGTVTLWTPLSRQDCQPGPSGDRPRAFAFVRDGAGESDRLVSWDLSGFYPDPTREAYVRSFCFSPDGRVAATGHENGRVRLWDPRTGKPRSLEPAHSGLVRPLAFSRDASLLATSSSDEGTVRIWELPAGRKRCDLSADCHLYGIQFSGDGRTLFAASDDNTVRRWDTRTGQPQPPLEGHEDIVYCLAVSPDGELLASGGADRRILLWDTVTGRRVAPLFGHADHITALAFSPDGQTLASTGDDRQLKFWSVSSGHELLSLEQPRRLQGTIHFSPDGRTMVTHDRDGAHFWTTGVRWRRAADQASVKGMTVHETYDEPYSLAPVD